MANPLLLLTLILLVPIFFLLILSIIVRPRPAKIPIKNRHVLITGGSSGIGLAIALQAAAAGARISLLARSLPKLEKARRSIRFATGIDASILSADVRDATAVARALEKAGPVDVLVCNQGVFTPRELEEMEIEDVRFMMEVNVMGTFHLIKAALPGMKRRVKETAVPGSIAIVSSQAGQVGLYGYTAYSASKFALRGLGEALQQEVIADNIHVSLIFPPDTETPGLVEGNLTQAGGDVRRNFASQRVEIGDASKSIWELSFEDDETIAEIFTRFTDIVNTSKVFEKIYPQAEQIRKILRSLPA